MNGIGCFSAYTSWLGWYVPYLVLPFIKRQNAINKGKTGVRVRCALLCNPINSFIYTTYNLFITHSLPSIRLLRKIVGKNRGEWVGWWASFKTKTKTKRKPALIQPSFFPQNFHLRKKKVCGRAFSADKSCVTFPRVITCDKFSADA